MILEPLQPQVFTTDTDSDFENAIARGETFVTDWANTQNPNNERIKLLYRGSSLTGARRAVRAASGEITWSDLVAETDQNKFWLASTVGAILIYASTNAAQRREGRGTILIYAILRSTLRALIASGNVTNRAGGPPPLDTGLEYGFDAIAVPNLFGPAVISRG